MSETQKNQAAKNPQPAPTIKTEQVNDAPMLGTDDAVLGTLSTDANPTTDQSSETSKSSMRKPDAPPADDSANSSSETSPSAPPVLTAEPAAAEPEPLRLPRGGFIAFRKSGGLQFSTREVVIYPDGRVAYDARGVPSKEYNRLRRALNDGQVLSLRKLLDQTNFWKTGGGGQQNPDAFAYEIAARVGQRSNEIEVFDGSMPETIKPLVERLTKLLSA